MNSFRYSPESGAATSFTYLNYTKNIQVTN
jgi:hypothetical protein